MDSLDRRTPLTRTSGVDSVVTTSSPNALDVRSPVSAGCQGLTLLAAFLAWGCEPPLEVGSWKCAAAPLYIPPDGSPELPGRDTVVDPAWESSFEDGFCGYIEARGFCYSDPDAGYELVESPARSGRKAAAFSIITDGNLEGRQTRCVREGQLPKDAFYTAYFYVPQGTKSMGNWNLMHFRTHTETDGLDGKWDVSLANNDDDELVPLLRGYVGDVPSCRRSTTRFRSTAGSHSASDYVVNRPRREWLPCTWTASCWSNARISSPMMTPRGGNGTSAI